MLTRAEEAALIALAAAARSRAYAGYSGFAVGAAVVADDDRTFFGCNVGNASLGLTLCAERAAIAAGVASGMRGLRAVVIVTGSDRPTWPCGACLQWIAEFGGPSAQVVCATVAGKVQRARLSELLPNPFQRTHVLLPLDGGG
jgi:cytidine deaminase